MQKYFSVCNWRPFKLLGGQKAAQLAPRKGSVDPGRQRSGRSAPWGKGGLPRLGAGSGPGGGCGRSLLVMKSIDWAGKGLGEGRVI